MLPTSGITTEIVRLKLDENFKDIGLLCTSNKINMWSKNFDKTLNRVTPITVIPKDYNTIYFII